MPHHNKIYSLWIYAYILPAPAHTGSTSTSTTFDLPIFAVNTHADMHL